MRISVQVCCQLHLTHKKHPKILLQPPQSAHSMHYNFGMFYCVGGCARSCVCVCCARAKPICTPPQCLSALLLNMRVEWILCGVLHLPPKQQVRFNGVRALHSAHKPSIMRLMPFAVAAIPRPQRSITSVKKAKLDLRL